MYVDLDPGCHEDGWETARSTAVGVAMALAFGGTYVVAYGFDQYLTDTEWLGRNGTILQFGVVIGVIVLHEVAHALTYAIVCGLSWNEIDVVVELVAEKSLELVLTRSIPRDRSVAGSTTSASPHRHSSWVSSRRRSDW